MRAFWPCLILLVFSACSNQKVDDGSIDLSGAWKYQKGDSIEWRKPTFDDKSWKTLQIPGDLIEQIGDEGEAKAWLRTTYTVTQNYQTPQSLLLGVIGDVDEVYIDGYLIGKTGSPPPNLRLTPHKYRNYLLSAAAVSKGPHTVAVRIYKWGGPAMGIVGDKPVIMDYFGASDRVVSFKVVRTDIPFALAIFLFFMGAYLILIYLTCPVERQYFYCSMACISLGMYCFLDSWKMTDSFDIDPQGLSVRIVMAMLTICNYTTFRFVRSASRKAMSRMDKICYWLTWFFIVAFMLTPNYTVLNEIIVFLIPLGIFTNGYNGITLYKNLRATRRKSAYVLFFIYLFLMACVVHDAYCQFFAPYALVFIEYGYFFQCLGISYFLAQDYSGALVDRIETKKLVRKSEYLEEAIAKDPLTGLVSREAFMEMFENEIAKAKSEGSSLTLAIMDVDHFKFYNDSYGHPAGDRLLSSMGWIIKKWTRANDTCGRLGGEEFGILLRKTSLVDAYRACERLRKNLETFPFEFPGKENKHISVSIGLVTLSDKASNQREMYVEADRQLYEAKKVRNCIEPNVAFLSRDIKTSSAA